MRYDKKNDCVDISASELAEYAFQRENPSVLSEKYGFVKNVYPSYPPETGSAQSEATLDKRIVYGEYSIRVSGLADSISFNGFVHTVEMLKNVSYFPRDLSPLREADQFAYAVICAYIYADSAAVSEVNIKMTYVRRADNAKISFTAPFKRIELTRMFEALLSRAYVIISTFATRHRLFPSEAENMPFPYHSIRDGQIEFINSAYRCIKRGSSLLVSAPTGIGKTMSVLFPAIKSAGIGAVDKIFYLTAKNVTGKAALDALARITKYAPHLRSVMICAKEMMCPLRKKNSKASDSEAAHCKYCGRCDSISKDFGKTHISYKERQLEALEALLLSENTVYTPEMIIDAAERFELCPHELALDLSESCLVVICDYNYVIDDNVRFKRYFKNVKNTEKYVFLFDEAHNLPDRTRNTYSAVLSSRKLEELTALSETVISDDPEFTSSVGELWESVKYIKSLCTEHEYSRSTSEGEMTCGYYESAKIPDELVRCAGNTARCIRRIIRDNGEHADLLENFYRELSKIVFTSSFFDEKFRFFASRENDEVKIEILCLDPSGILKTMLSAAHANILFSATLSPIEYFSEVTGFECAETLELASPYENDNLCLVGFDSISTKFNDRRETAFKCAEVIAEAISAKDGNYIVYFPSYDYMKRVCRIFAEIAPEYSIVIQKQSMSYRERERFLSLFGDRSRGAVIGFCVLGGMFSEGIDLAGESLIGAVIVGIGMPQLSAERNIMAAYYNEKNERGHEFAYVCPGMNKVMQAAGRVIRSENDKGVIILIDERFSDPSMKLMLPAHWRHIKFTGDTDSMRAVLDDFWSSH